MCVWDRIHGRKAWTMLFLYHSFQWPSVSLLFSCLYVHICRVFNFTWLFPSANTFRSKLVPTKQFVLLSSNNIKATFSYIPSFFSPFATLVCVVERNIDLLQITRASLDLLRIRMASLWNLENCGVHLALESRTVNNDFIREFRKNVNYDTSFRAAVFTSAGKKIIIQYRQETVTMFKRTMLQKRRQDWNSRNADREFSSGYLPADCLSSLVF